MIITAALTRVSSDCRETLSGSRAERQHATLEAEIEATHRQHLATADGSCWPEAAENKGRRMSVIRGTSGLIMLMLNAHAEFFGF
jgi:hypothetical protein